MEVLRQLVTARPLLALFITISLGYVVGKIRIGAFVLGGIAGTLLVGVVIGQFGINIDSDIKSIFFDLFIFAVGFQGGPQFFHALNRRSLSQLISAIVRDGTTAKAIPPKTAMNPSHKALLKIAIFKGIYLTEMPVSQRNQ